MLYPAFKANLEKKGKEKGRRKRKRRREMEKTVVMMMAPLVKEPKSGLFVLSHPQPPNLRCCPTLIFTKAEAHRTARPS